MTYPVQIPSQKKMAVMPGHFTQTEELHPLTTHHNFIYKKGTPAEYRIALPAAPQTADEYWDLAEQIIASTQELKNSDKMTQEFFAALFTGMPTQRALHESFIKKLRAAEKQFFARTEAANEAYQIALNKLFEDADSAILKANLLTELSATINTAADEQGKIVYAGIENYKQQKVRLIYLVRSYQLFEKVTRLEQCPRISFVVNLLLDAAQAGHAAAQAKIATAFDTERLPEENLLD
jgi:hypothetical protein